MLFLLFLVPYIFLFIQINKQVKKIDWSRNLPDFKEQAHYLPLVVTAHVMATCVEAYFDLYKGKTIEENKNPDLHSAEMILRIIRNSLSHPYVDNLKIAIRWNVQSKQYQRTYEIKKLGIVLHASNLNGQEFKMAEIGGWGKFIELLNYLESSVSNEFR